MTQIQLAFLLAAAITLTYAKWSDITISDPSHEIKWVDSGWLVSDASNEDIRLELKIGQIYNDIAFLRSTILEVIGKGKILLKRK